VAQRTGVRITQNGLSNKRSGKSFPLFQPTSQPLSLGTDRHILKKPNKLLQEAQVANEKNCARASLPMSSKK
ncbi:MAG: hypothetical protein RBT64_15150, partial [Trichloromonas sp.]|nr:hypothetical protein [Trichloromonas sp.]